MNAKTIRLLVVLSVAGAAAYALFYLKSGSTQSASVSVPHSVPPSPVSTASAGGVPPAPSAVATPDAPPVSAEPSVTNDSTIVDRVNLPRRRVFTPEQQAQLDQLREKAGEAEMQIQEAIRQRDVARSGALSNPSMQPLVKALQTARADLEAFTRSHPERAATEKKFSDATRESNRVRSRVEALDIHHGKHLVGAGPSLVETCEWCKRDADRIRARDVALEKIYTGEMNQLKLDLQTREQDLLDTRHRMASVRRGLYSSGEGQVFQERVAQAQKALDEAFATVPAVTARRREEAEARERQQALMKDYSAIYQQGGLVEATLASGVEVNGSDRKAQ